MTNIASGSTLLADLQRYHSNQLLVNNFETFKNESGLLFDSKLIPNELLKKLHSAIFRKRSYGTSTKTIGRYRQRVREWLRSVFDCGIVSSPAILANIARDITISEQLKLGIREIVKRSLVRSSTINTVQVDESHETSLRTIAIDCATTANDDDVHGA